MKKFYVLALVLITFNLSAQIINDDLESYSLGSYLGEHWGSWDKTTGAAIKVTSDQAFSGTQSATIVDAGQDALLIVGNRFYGTYTLQWKMYMPSGRSSWLGYMEQVDDFSGDVNFPVNMGFSLISGTVSDINLDDKFVIWTGGTIQGVADYPKDEWFTLTFFIDLDNFVFDVYLNDSQIVDDIAYESGIGQFAGVDLWKYDDGWSPFTNIDSSNLPCEYFVDDVVFVEGNLGTSDITSVSSIKTYPNPVKDFLNVSAKENISSVIVYNTAGQEILKTNPKSNTTKVNMGGLAKGVYVVKIITDKETKTSKVVVK